MSCRVHRWGVLEGVPDDNMGSVLCRAGSIGGEYLKEYLMTIGGVLCVVQGSSARSSGKSVFSFSLV